MPKFIITDWDILESRVLSRLWKEEDEKMMSIINIEDAEFEVIDSKINEQSSPIPSNLQLITKS